MKYLKNNYDFSVPLRCIVCGSDDCFEFNDDKSFVKCTKCGKEYPGGYDELVSCNEAFIEGAKEEVLDNIKEDLQKEVHQMFKDAFKGSKFIKIK